MSKDAYQEKVLLSEVSQWRSYPFLKRVQFTESPNPTGEFWELDFKYVTFLTALQNQLCNKMCTQESLILNPDSEQCLDKALLLFSE